MESPKSSLKIVRVSSLDEAYELVDVACESFADDPLYALMLPNHKDHPEVFQETWSTNFREDYGKKGSVILAARNVDTGEFVAFAVWVRYGTSYVAQSWQGDTWDKKLMRLKIKMEQIFGFLTGGPDPNHVSVDAINVLVAGAIEAEKLYPAERWSLTWLGVSPKCQRTGIGRRLTQWGVDRSEEEGVPAVMFSSAPGKPLYEKLGFKEIGRVVYDKDGNTQPVMLRPVEGQGTA